MRLDPQDSTSRSWRAGSTYVFGQTQTAAAGFAASRGEPLGAPHLLVALLEGDPETQRTLTGAGMDTRKLRRSALHVLGAPTDLAPIAMPPLTPAGTVDRPPLDVEDLDPHAWRGLSWRQNHLPLDHVRRACDAAALAALEQQATWRIADHAGVDDDQRYSPLSHHRRAVDQRLTPVKVGFLAYLRAQRLPADGPSQVPSGEMTEG